MERQSKAKGKNKAETWRKMQRMPFLEALLRPHGLSVLGIAKFLQNPSIGI
jgi:hypothetical protein